MKIGILTQPLRYNYGGILQNFALQTVLKRMGHEPVTLDQTQIESHSWAYWIVAYVRRILLRAMGKWPYPLFSEIETLRVNKKILVNTRAFVNKYIRIQWETKYEKLHNKDFDALIVGSDQVWRPGGVRDIKLYFFSFARNWSGIKRIAYAASFATDEWEFSQEQTEECKKLADLFDAISVREETGVQLCADNLKHDATWVIDPTMLLTPQDYTLELDIKHDTAHANSLFYYILDENESKINFVEKISKHKDLMPFRVNSKAEDTSASVYERIQPPVENFIQAFYDADFVVTDSFHAVVFSILFNKPFYVICNTNRGAARFVSILSMFGLENRMIEDVPERIPEINWEPINELLKKRRKESMRFLYDVLT